MTMQLACCGVCSSLTLAVAVVAFTAVADDGQNVIRELKVNGKTIAPGAFKGGVHAFPLKPGDLKPGYNEFAVTVDPKFGPSLAFHDFAVYLRKRDSGGWPPMRSDAQMRRKER